MKNKWDRPRMKSIARSAQNRKKLSRRVNKNVGILRRIVNILVP